MENKAKSIDYSFNTQMRNNLSENEECVFIINGKVTDPEDFPDIGQADYD